eukprot:1189947-Prorocentrum_minimum.AAC.3
MPVKTPRCDVASGEFSFDSPPNSSRTPHVRVAQMTPPETHRAIRSIPTKPSDDSEGARSAPEPPPVCRPQVGS